MDPLRNGWGINYTDLTFSTEEFDIDDQTTVYVNEDYIYLFSDFSCGLSIYNLAGDYIETYYFPYFQNGRATMEIIDDIVYISPRDTEYIYAIRGKDYYGKVQQIWLEDDTWTEDSVYTYIIYNVSNESQDQFSVLYLYWFVGFDYEYIYTYNYNLDGYYKVNSEGISEWDGSHIEVTSSYTFANETYRIIGPNLYVGDDVLITSSYLYNLQNNFMLHWIAVVITILTLMAAQLPDRKRGNYMR